MKTELTPALLAEIKAGTTPVARYVGQYAHLHGKYDYLWDELAAAAWLDPSLITKKDTRFMDANLSRGPEYGNTLTWSDLDKPRIVGQPVEIQLDLDRERFYRLFVELLTATTPVRH